MASLTAGSEESRTIARVFVETLEILDSLPSYPTVRLVTPLRRMVLFLSEMVSGCEPPPCATATLKKRVFNRAAKNVDERVTINLSP
jgi:hypothetical protein